MIYKCQNCGGNVLYDPAKGVMRCPHCDGIDSEERIKNSGDMMTCGNCGAPMTGAVKAHTSACKCPSCGIYTIVEERVENEFKPDVVLPFRISKGQAVKAMKDTFRNRIFTPLTFLNHATVKSMEGVYVPFFLYDYEAEGSYHGNGTRVRTWSDSNYRYTETSHYVIDREAEACYSKVPVDASTVMEDDCMDLLEPFKYESLTEFDPKYLSGFFSEKNNDDEVIYSPRAEKKIKQSMNQIIKDSIVGYSTESGHSHVILKDKKVTYALLPVWKYVFRSKDVDYPFYVNGQTGKVIGKTPVDTGMVFLYSASVFGLVSIAGLLIRLLITYI